MHLRYVHYNGKRFYQRAQYKITLNQQNKVLLVPPEILL